MLVYVAAAVPLTVHGIYGSAVIIGNTANNIHAPKNDIAPENKLPEYFKFFSVVLLYFYLHRTSRPIINDIKPPYVNTVYVPP